MIKCEDVQKELRELGLSGSYLGFRYLTHAIQMVVEDETQLLYVSKSLYATIADHYHTSIYCVERDIRTAIRIIWEKGDREALSKIFSNRPQERPTNSAFIDIFAVFMRKDEKKK